MTGDRGLAELATLHGVQLGYTAQDGHRVRTMPDTLRAVLKALGHPAEDSAALADELAAARQRATRPLEPVVVAEPGGVLSSPIRLPRGTDAAAGRITITREDGAASDHPLESLTLGARKSNGGDVDELAIDLSGLDLPVGYHHLTLSGVGLERTALLLVPPVPPEVHHRGLALFAPLYALRGDRDWGIGSFGDLGTFAELAGSWGGQLAGTLPLFAMNFGEPMDPSPYLPVSRLFWNELYVDVPALPEVAASPAIRSMVQATAPDRERLSSLVDADYAAVMALKRPIFDAAARSLVAQPSDRRDEFDSFVKSHPTLDLYADYRAADVPEQRRAETALHHRYVQFVASEQLAAAANRRAGLYLDLPVGVHPDGFDVTVNPLLFGAAGVGAPPDPLCADGQSWGFPPLHPERIRESGYRYLIDTYRTAMQFTSAVRIDHVLGLQRLFWIPNGAGAEAGAYVRYRSEEARAIIAIEAERSGTVVVGEDLGTVSPSIRHAMDRDRMLHTFVYQFEASPDDLDPQPTRPSMSSLGGHDLPKFAAFWPEFAGDADASTAFVERLVSLAAGPSSYVTVDVGDLLGETVQDNRPGTGPEARNWRHRLPCTLREIAGSRDIVALMSAVRSARDTAMVKGAGA